VKSGLPAHSAMKDQISGLCVWYGMTLPSLKVR
jgi:hypothetical protein